MKDGRYEMEKSLEMEQHRPMSGDTLAFNLLFYLNKLKQGICFQPQTGNTQLWLHLRMLTLAAT